MFISSRKRDRELQTQLCSLPHAWRMISYIELLQATNGFNESNLLGVGSFGSVYKGTLSDEVNVAVNVFNLQLEEAFKSFNVECEVLHDIRLNIMIDVASALEYLHHGQGTPILHCNLKPNNVLLDKDMIAHVCDFAIAILLGEDEFMAQTKTLATIGYMAPDYGREEIVSTKRDVHSYAVLLMETFTRKKPTYEMFSDEMTTRSWVYEASFGSIVQVVDANLIGLEDENFSSKKECASSILHLALDCSKDFPT
ncbi:hypothetical protein LguiA_004707 [Lonicera macranthoides]